MIQKIDKVFYRISAAIGSLSYVGIVAMTLLNIGVRHAHSGRL